MHSNTPSDPSDEQFSDAHEYPPASSPDGNDHVYYDIEYPAPVESPNDYCVGGFHPVHLGDTLGNAGRYRVVHKLGDGGFATVWLCRDLYEQKWRAVKINAAAASNPEHSPEFAVSERFADVTPEALAQQHIALPIEYFWMDGPNGRHLCAVMPLLGPRVTELYNWYGNYPELLKGVCFQITKGMSYLHQREICHGDLRPENILFQLDDRVDSMSEEELTQLLGSPKRVKVIASDGAKVADGVPEYLVPQACLNFSSGLCSTKVSITDLGICYDANDPPLDTGIPTKYAAPEDIFRRSTLGPATDVWTLGCTIACIATGLMPFGEVSEVHPVMWAMEDLMGPSPQPFRAAWKEEFKYEYKNDENDESLAVSMPQKNSAIYLKERIESTGFSNKLLASLVKENYRLYITHAQAAEVAKQDYRTTGLLPGFTQLPSPGEWEDRMDFERDEQDMKLLFDLLTSIFKWHPEDRVSADKILDHEWFEVWSE